MARQTGTGGLGHRRWPQEDFSALALIRARNALEWDLEVHGLGVHGRHLSSLLLGLTSELEHLVFDNMETSHDLVARLSSGLDTKVFNRILQTKVNTRQTPSLDRALLSSKHVCMS